MRECQIEPRRLSQLLDGELPEAEAMELRGHLRTCAQCQGIYRRFAGLSDALYDTMAEPPADLTARVMAQIRDETQPNVTHISEGKRRKKHSAFAPLLSTAAILAVIVGVIAISGRWLPVQTEAESARTQAVELANTQSKDTAAKAEADSDVPLAAENAFDFYEDAPLAGVLGVSEVDDAAADAVYALLHDGEKTKAPREKNTPVCVLRREEEEILVWIDEDDVIYTEDGEHYYRLPDQADALRAILGEAP